MAELLSQNVATTLDQAKFKSSIILFIYITYCVTYDVTIYLTFDDDNDVISYFL